MRSKIFASQGWLPFFTLPFLAALHLGPANAEPVALVLDVAGAVSPELAAFSEIEAGASFDLGAGSRLEFLHYPTCQQVIVEGGKLSLSAENFRVNKGKVIDATRADCPQRLVLASNESGSGIGGVVLRGADAGSLKVSRRPAFLLLGGGGRFDRAKVMQSGTVLFESPLGNTALNWPDSAPALQADADYVLVLSGPGAASRSIALAVGKQQRQKAPAIIQIE